MKPPIGTFYGAAASLMAVALQATPVLQGTASAQDVDVVIQDIDLGVTVTGICTHDEGLKLVDAWLMLLRTIRDTPALASSFSSCIDNAALVELPCDDQLDRRRIKDPILNDDAVWSIECVNWKPGVDADGNPTQMIGLGDVGISGTSMQVHQPFIMMESVDEIAALMAHELMHNRGFDHAAHPFGDPLHPLTVSEQVESCVRTVLSGASSNSPPAGFVDWKNCCAAGNSWCDASGACFTAKEACYASCSGGITSGPEGSWQDIQYFCGLVPHDSSSKQLPWGSFDAEMCPVTYLTSSMTAPGFCDFDMTPIADPRTAPPPPDVPTISTP